MRKFLFIIINYSLLIFNSAKADAQLKWANVDSLYGPLPSSVHVYFTNEPIDTAPFKAYYLIADLKDKKLLFDVDTTLNRRLTPAQFYQKNSQPLVVVNCTFFSFETNRNLNVVIKDGKLVSYNTHTFIGRGKDTLTYRHPFGSALGITKKGNADVAWLYTDSSLKSVYAVQLPVDPLKDSLKSLSFKTAAYMTSHTSKGAITPMLRRWRRINVAVGGGPVLLQLGKETITNNEEIKFAGKAINDKHPRTAMGYTKDGKLIILVVEGRSESASGATLIREAKILQELGCWEALNLDGGGSSCLLVNGKQTIKPSDKEGQRAVPAVFIIKALKKLIIINY